MSISFVILTFLSVFSLIVIFLSMRRTTALRSLRTENAAFVNSKISSTTIATNAKAYNPETYELIRKIVEQRLSGVVRQFKNMERNQRNVIDHNGYERYELEVISPMSQRKINYADELLGASIQNIEAIPARPKIFLNWLGIKTIENRPEQMIQSNMVPGACFAFKNAKAVVTIVLAKRIHIQSIELQHISKSLSPTKTTVSAPRHFRVYAIHDTSDETDLGEFEFINHEPFQVFDVAVKLPSNLVRVHFLTNHGHPNITCVYKLAIYGDAYEGEN